MIAFMVDYDGVFIFVYYRPHIRGRTLSHQGPPVARRLYNEEQGFKPSIDLIDPLHLYTLLTFRLVIFFRPL